MYLLCSIKKQTFYRQDVELWNCLVFGEMFISFIQRRSINYWTIIVFLSWDFRSFDI